MKSIRDISYINAYNQSIEIIIKGKDILSNESLIVKGVEPLKALEIARENSISLHLECSSTEAIKVIESFDNSFFSKIQELKYVVGELVNYTVQDSANKVLKSYLKGEKYSTESIVLENYCNCLTLERYEKMTGTQKLIFEKISKGISFSSIQELDDTVGIENAVELFNEYLNDVSPSKDAFYNNVDGISLLKEYVGYSDDEFITHLTNSKKYKSSDDIIVVTFDDEIYSLTVYDVYKQLEDDYKYNKGL